jgi:hypothetical protein
MRQHLKKFILLALNQCDGTPMPDAALINAVKLMARPALPTSGDVQDAINSAEADGYVSGVSDDLTGRSWTLTTKGVHKARTL